MTSDNDSKQIPVREQRGEKRATSESASSVESPRQENRGSVAPPSTDIPEGRESQSDGVARPSREPRGRSDRSAGQERGRPGPQGGPGPQSAKQHILQEVSERALQANSLLRAHLTGTLGIILTNSGEQFAVEWISEKPHVRAGAPENADCVIHVSEQNFLKIASGELNPQIGMLSDKIKVEGKLSFAVYFFNLVVPRGASQSSV